MKINDDDLRAIWQQPRADGPSGRSTCLTEAEWTRLLSGEADNPERVRAAHHVASCTACADEYRLLQPLRSWAADVELALSPRGATRTDRWAGWRAWWSSPRVALPLAAAAVLLVANGVILSQLVESRRENAHLETRLAEREDALSTRQEALAALAEARRGQTAPQARLDISEQRRAQLPGGLPTDPSSAASDSTTAIVAIDSGGRKITVDDQSNINGLEGVPPSVARAVRGALIALLVEPPASISGLVGKQGTLLGVPGDRASFRVIAPVGTVVPDTRPTFRWQRLRGAIGYTVTVYDVNFNPIATSPTLTVTEWRVPEPLERGREYAWQVTAVSEGQEIQAPVPPAPEARFKVLDHATAEKLAQARQADGDSHLRMTVFLVKEGLLDDAERQLQQLIAANPASSFPKELLRSVEAIRRPTP